MSAHNNIWPTAVRDHFQMLNENLTIGVNEKLGLLRLDFMIPDEALHHNLGEWEIIIDYYQEAKGFVVMGHTLDEYEQRNDWINQFLFREPCL